MTALPCDRDLDVLAAIIGFERIRTALHAGRYDEAVRHAQSPRLTDAMNRLHGHVADDAWQWADMQAAAVPGDDEAWLAYVAADLEQHRQRPRRWWHR